MHTLEGVTENPKVLILALESPKFPLFYSDQVIYIYDANQMHGTDLILSWYCKGNLNMIVHMKLFLEKVCSRLVCPTVPFFVYIQLRLPRHHPGYSLRIVYACLYQISAGQVNR